MTNGMYYPSNYQSYTPPQQSSGPGLGEVMQTVGAGLSLLNPVFSAVSMIGGMLSSAEQTSLQHRTLSNSMLSNLTNAYNAAWSTNNSILAHENNLTQLDIFRKGLAKNISTLKENKGVVAGDYKRLFQTLESQGSQVGSYQDLLYSVSGVREESGTAGAVRDYTENQLAAQRSQAERSKKQELSAIQNQIEDLKTKDTGYEAQEASEGEALEALRGEENPEWVNDDGSIDYEAYLDPSNDNEKAKDLRTELGDIGSSFREFVYGEADSFLQDLFKQHEWLWKETLDSIRSGNPNILVTEFVNSPEGKRYGLTEEKVLDAVKFTFTDWKGWDFDYDYSLSWWDFEIEDSSSGTSNVVVGRERPPGRPAILPR